MLMIMTTLSKHLQITEEIKSLRAKKNRSRDISFQIMSFSSQFWIFLFFYFFGHTEKFYPKFYNICSEAKDLDVENL